MSVDTGTPDVSTVTARFAFAILAAMTVSVVLHAPTVGDSLLVAWFGGAPIAPGEAVGIDFEVYRQAALRLESGLPLYADPLFIYPPIFAHVWRWTIGTGAYAYDIYRALSWGVFVLTPIVAIWPHRRALERWAPRHRFALGLALVGASTFLDPLRLSMAMGNIDHFIVFALLVAYLAYRQGLGPLAGAIVGVAGAMKIMPLMLLGVLAAGAIGSFATERPHPGGVRPGRSVRLRFVLSAFATAALALGAFPSGLVDFVAHYPNVEADYRVFSLSAVLTRLDLVTADLAPKLNLAAAVALGTWWGFRYRRDDERAWIAGTILVYLANPRGNAYTLAVLVLPALALAMRTEPRDRVAAALLASTLLIGNLIAFGSTATLFGALTILVICVLAGSLSPRIQPDAP
jgi:hypothetical protein